MEIIKKSIKDLNEQERYQRQRIQLVIDAGEKTEKLDHDAAVQEKHTKTAWEATTKVDEKIPMQFISNKEDGKQDEEKLIKEDVSTLRTIQCYLCKGEHWTTECPYKVNFQSNDKPAENVATSTTKPTLQGQNPASGALGEATSGEWYSLSARRAGAGTAYPGDRGEGSEGGSTRGGSYGGRGSDLEKQDEATVRVTNLPEEPEEQYLRNLFTPIGPVSRVYLTKDETNNTSKGFAFITFNEKKDAQKAIECVSGFCYDDLILKVEWANESQNQ